MIGVFFTMKFNTCVSCLHSTKLSSFKTKLLRSASYTGCGKK